MGNLVNGTSNDRVCSFEKVLNETTTQSEVFDQCEGSKLSQSFLNGQNCNIFVYGPTSTGKTHTMQGLAKGEPIKATRKVPKRKRTSKGKPSVVYVADSDLFPQSGSP